VGFVLSFWEVGGQNVNQTFAPPAMSGGYQAGSGGALQSE
jgi:hypothetical protein